MTLKRIIAVGFMVLLIEGVAGYIYLTHRQNNSLTPSSPIPSATPRPTLAPLPKKAILSLESSSAVIKKNDRFMVNVKLDTFSNPTSAVDLTMKYDPKSVSISATDSAHPFAETALYQRMVFNSVDAKQGLATMSAVADIGKNFKGSSILTSLPFKALKTGPVDISIVFTRGDTRDTNVVSDTEDILESVQNLSLSILP